MSLALVAANAPSLGDWLSPGISARVDHDSYPTLNARNTSTTRNNTVNLFIDSVDATYEYGASIVSAYVDQTVYAIQCTKAAKNVGTATCGPNGPIATLTSGPSKYEISSAITTKSLGHDFTITVQETCVLAGTTAATCTATVQATADGKSTSTSTAEIISGTNYKRFDVEITAGAEKTINPPAAATTSAKSAAASLNTKTMAIWALTGVVGVASILTIL